MNDQNLEPEAENLLKTGKMADTISPIPPLYSIAISLKRIADQLEYQPAGDANIFDYIRMIGEKANRD